MLQMVVLKVPKDHKTLLVGRIQSYFDTEFSQSVGNLAAENLLDFMLKQLSPVIYNQAIRDARVVITQQMDRIEEDLYALEQPLEV